MSRIFERNGTIKIISIIFAIILWLYAVSELNPETTRTLTEIPIQIVREDTLRSNNFTLVYDPPRQVTVRIRGLANDIRRIEAANIKATLDLGAINKTGIQRVPVNIELPRELKLDRAIDVQVTINHIVSKYIPIEIELTGEVSEAYQIHPANITMDSILLTGAESLVKEVVQGIVHINLDNRQRTIEQSLPIQLIDDQNKVLTSKYMQLQEEFIIVTIPIYPKKNVAVELNLTGSPGEGYEVEAIEINPKDITINGEPEILENVFSMITEMVDIENARSDVRRTVGLQEITGIFLDPARSEQISVVVRIKQITIERSLILEEIVFFGLPEGLSASYQTEGIEVLVSGPYHLVNSLELEDIKVIADVSELEPGEYEVPLSLLLPEDVEGVHIAPEIIKIKLYNS